jgi:hypothetical protein
MALVLGAVLVMVAALSGTASAEPTADDWYRLRVCESGNNYAINTGNGYYGAYQFNLGTWRGVGGTGYPHQASPAVQDALALTLYRQRGWSPWACARILGLPVRPDVPTPPPPAPIGNFESAVEGNGSVVVQGWALDPNSPATSIQLHVYVNSTGNVLTADKPRPDVNAAFGVGGDHGFNEAIAIPPGVSQVCVYAIGVSWPNNTGLGCRTVGGPVPPTGHWDGLQSTGYTANFAGWAADLNSPATSIQIHAYLNGAGTSLIAGDSRPDVNAIGIGGNHGFTGSAQLAVGANQLCLYAIGVNWPNNATLGCRAVQGPPAMTGNIDSIGTSGSSVVVSGWSVDGRTPWASNDVHVYINGAGYVGTANAGRPDVNAALGISGNHGFSLSYPLQSGANNVCVYAITTAVNASAGLGCRTVYGA